jgi:phage tail sheath protein FI
LVDTFACGIEEESKSVYTLLCQGRQSALALINCPSQAEFKKSTDPSFVNIRNSVEAEFIAKGGDASKTPSFLYSLPTMVNGASFGAYYYPFLKISDLGSTKSVPPAPYVSNLYMAKYNSSNAWSIVAGQRRGVISGNQVIGVEATLVHDNRDWLEPVGINSIIWEQGVGVEVYANKTAKQTPVSALSSIHVREAAIYIQDSVETILRKYVFEFNTAQSRMEIKTLVDEFLNNMKNNGGLYDFRTVMDTSNNTPEVIDNNMGVIDIYVEIVRGLEIIAQRLTILRTGAIAAGGFDE